MSQYSSKIHKQTPLSAFANQAEPDQRHMSLQTFPDRRSEALAQRKQQNVANASSQVRHFQLMQQRADRYAQSRSSVHLLQRMPAVIQRRISAADERNMEYFFGKKEEASVFLQGLSKAKAWKQIDTFVKWNGTKKNDPTHEEIAAYYKCEIEAPVVEEEETSDIKRAYDVKKGCALQGLIGYGLTPYGQESAAALHNHIWNTPQLSAFKEYDIKWEALFQSLGLEKIANPADKIEDLPDGKYLCETPGHMMAVSVVDGTPTLLQDRGNAIGKVKDTIKTTYQ